MVRVTAFAAALVLAGSVAVAGSLEGLGKDLGKQVGQSAKEGAMGNLTKKLKKVEKGPIRFKKGKAEVDPACDRTMRQIAAILADFPGFHVQVDGHTDNVGKPEANLKLSQARAEAVVNYLVEKKGVAAKRLSAKGWGDSQPIADNKTEKGRAKNRRVDFTVTKL
jgi:outer membrane protein OmpA-like peptidoglycan-associated protein